jgi:HrpA-like RNA helicase
MRVANSSDGLPKMPTLADLQLTTTQVRSFSNNKISDGNKKVPYKSNQTRSTRVSQSHTKPVISENVEETTPTRFRAAPSQPIVEKENTNWQKSKTFPVLPITPHGEAIAKMILENQVSAIDSNTGSGKTRKIPNLMATKGFKVRVAIPTTVAVRDAYKFQCQHSTLQVGYAAGREIHYNEDDQLVYGTTGHFTQRILSMIKAGHQDQIMNILGDIFFIDEVHVATSHITVLISLLRFLYFDSVSSLNEKGPKIVFASATFNQGDIVEYFPKFPIYKVEIPSWPIEDIFLLNQRDLLKDDPSDEIIRIIREELGKWEGATKKYHGIVFRPGLQEVEETIEYLESKFNANDPIEFYPAYSNLDPKEIDQIFQSSDKMKVIIGTNIIESSITIEDVGFIIDDMLEKIAETSSTGGNKLTLSVISKSASQQRRGRTGRTLPGRNYKLIDRLSYDRLSEYQIREIDRIPIFNIVLQLIDAGLNPLEVLKISVDRYEQAQKLLVDIGMIENKDGKYFVTEIGRFVSSISMGVQNAYMVYLGFKRFQKASLERPGDLAVERIILRTVIAVASMIESYGPSYFYIPRKGRNESQIEYVARKDDHIEQYHEKFRGQTDIHSFVNIFWEMMTDINLAKKYDRGSRKNGFTNYVKEWSVANSMNNKKIKEYLNVMRDIESVVEGKISDNTELRTNLPSSSLGKDLPKGGFSQLGNVVAIIFARAYSGNQLVRTRDLRNNFVYVDQKTQIPYKINKSSSFNSVVMNSLEGPMVIVVSQTVEVVGKQGRVYLCGIYVTSDFIPETKQEAIMREKEV